ncbi:ABC transporter ATP-binding protein [Treponema sp.]|uniref:ABC transporter ATP-binding protein n=1 Tax=Treponema sp. TaxID=166 RepID=UPI0025CC0B1B|nr:ABC transporter ATP-binding protein [Treponema sp.]MCR5218989.1 ABC transporter ATP-binding protein/permease [Treponema sp.]
MFKILNRFFQFCDKTNRNKFYKSIIIGIFNSFFIALKIGAVAVMLKALLLDVCGQKKFTVDAVWQSFAVMGISVLGAVITKKVMSMLQCEGGYNTCASKRIEIAEHLRYLPMGYFNQNNPGDITSVTTNTMEMLGDVATRAVMIIMQGTLDSLLIIAMIFFFEWKIALIALGGFLIFQAVNYFMRFAVKKVSAEKIKIETNQVGKILEYIQGMTEVRAYNLSGKKRKELNTIIDQCVSVNGKLELHCIPFSAIQSFCAKLCGVVIMMASIWLYLKGQMIIANCMIMLICSFMLFLALEAGGNYAALLRIIDLSVKKAEAILNIPSIDIDGKNIPENAKNKSLDIEVKDVDFSYGSKKIIDNVSFKIPEKSVTAFVGPSGSGKTTLCHLLARFWDVNKGSVSLAGVNVKDYNMDDLMANFSFVFQNVYLFHDTIANNIRFGKPDTPMEEVIAAAKKACCHDFISSLPDGYETVIGEGGASLSGGEKQRISIARAIMKNAPIIILDEATANVDPENERDLMKAIEELTKEKTVIMIAHRLKTVSHADQIFVLDKGKIVESGKHEELLKKNGLYSRFINSRKEAVSWKI